MRILTFEQHAQRRLGLRVGDTILDLSRADPSLPADMRSFIAQGGDALARAGRVARANEGGIPAGEVLIKTPIPDPGKIICIGLNYADHAAETHNPIPSEPVVFSKYTTTLAGPNDAIPYPNVSKKVDYEVELVAVIGRGGRNIPEARALDHVFGYTIGNDISARDYQLEKPAGQWLLGKNFDNFCPIGPEIVTADELGDPHRLGIRCSVNGEVLQDSSTDQLIFPVDQLVAYLSHVFTLTPGDLILTGTPAGVGMGRTPPLWLKAGDTVVCEIERLGRLENQILQGPTCIG